jgi:hypothetical protein
MLCFFYFHISKSIKALGWQVLIRGDHYINLINLRPNLSRPQVPCGPPRGSKYAAMRKQLELGARSRLLALERGERGVLEVPGKTRKSGQA